ncbi:MAG TPA: LCP family protein [Candidatus Dormibacteraeota bacterium]|jgi:LCP family protein required for cell wall assembly
MPRNRRSSYRRAGAAGWRIRLLPSLSALLLGIALAAGSGGFAYFLPAIITGVQATGQSVVTALPSPLTPAASPVAQGPFTVLLLGSDDDAKFDPKHVLTQSMILVRVDPAAKSVTMLSIPRDLWVPLSTGGSAKIDGAYSYGGAGAAIATVQQNFQVHIDEYVWVGLKGLIKLIDAVGGVDIVASNPVLDDYYPNDIVASNPYGYKRVAVLPGPQHLDGVSALEYVRSRHGDLEGDFGRSQRQQQVLLAIRQKAKQLNAADIPDLAATFSGELKTSMGAGRVRDLLPLAGSLDNPQAIRQLVLLSPYTELGEIDSQSVVVPNWNLILPLVHQYFP